MRWTIRLMAFVVIFGACGLVNKALAQDAGRFIEQLTTSRGQITWNGLSPGMNRSTAEKVLGKPLALSNSPTPNLGAWNKYANVSNNALTVTLGFYVDAGVAVLTEISPANFKGQSQSEAKKLRAIALKRVPGLKENGKDFPLFSSAGIEIDISEESVRLQLGTDGE